MPECTDTLYLGRDNARMTGAGLATRRYDCWAGFESNFIGEDIEHDATRRTEISQTSIQEPV